MTDTSPERHVVEPTSEGRRKAFWLDPETAAELSAVTDQLAEKLGFRPTPSQTIRHILKGLKRKDQN